MLIISSFPPFFLLSFLPPLSFSLMDSHQHFFFLCQLVLFIYSLAYTWLIAMPPRFLMVFLYRCMLQSPYILVHILKGDNQINSWLINNRMATHWSSVHPFSCRDEFCITNTGGEKVLKRERVLAALTLQSPDRYWLLLLPITLLLILLWLIFYIKLPFMFSLVDIFMYIKQFHCRCAPGHKTRRWIGSPCVSWPQKWQSYLLEGSAEGVCLHSMNKSIAQQQQREKNPCSWVDVTHTCSLCTHLRKCFTSEEKERGGAFPLCIAA